MPGAGAPVLAAICRQAGFRQDGTKLLIRHSVRECEVGCGRQCTSKHGFQKLAERRHGQLLSERCEDHTVQSSSPFIHLPTFALHGFAAFFSKVLIPKVDGLWCGGSGDDAKRAQAMKPMQSTQIGVAAHGNVVLSLWHWIFDGEGCYEHRRCGIVRR